ncbi:MAG: hypothetical protein ABWJ98_01695 [Hydrogenothermaceae bacterium]
MSLIQKRKIYFAGLFSVIVFFAILIILKIPIIHSLDDFGFYIIIFSSITPATLLFLRDVNFKKKVLISYLPAILGFILSLLYNNSLYFLISFPIFFLNFIVIFPRSKDGKLS